MTLAALDNFLLADKPGAGKNTFILARKDWSVRDFCARAAQRAHIFLKRLSPLPREATNPVVGEDFRWKEPMLEGKGYSIVVYYREKPCPMPQAVDLDGSVGLLGGLMAAYRFGNED